MLNRQITPNIYSPIEFDYILSDCQQLVLKNGIPLYHYADHIQPVVQLELVFKAGLWYESIPALAQSVGALFKSGTSSMNSFQINETIEQYGASVKVGVGVDLASITISCLTKHLAKMLPLVLELITDTQFPEQEINIHTQNAKQRLSVQLLKGDFVANRKIDEFLFGIQHPYGRYVVAADYDQINSQNLSHFLKTYYQAGNCKMFLAGSFEEADLQLIQDTFGENHWNETKPIQEINFSAIPATDKKYRIVNDEQSVQGAIRLASPFPNKHHPDFYPMIILNTVFGGYFGSRLMSNIREDKGYTYGIHSYMYNHQQDGAYLITTEAGKDVSEAAIQEIYKEMEMLRNEPIGAEELTLVKNYLLGNILGDLDGAFQIMQRWKNLILNGYSKEKFNSNIQLYKTVTADQLQQLAQKYYQPENFYELIVT